jgi:uncharacterized protein (TIGR02271 family)
MITQNDLRKLLGATAHDPSGDKIGRIGQVYYDDDTDQPKWVTVHTGLFGTNESFVPLQEARFEGGTVTLGYDKQKIKNAPNVAQDRHLSPDEEAELYRYYDIRGYNQGGTGDAQGGGRHRATVDRQRNRGSAGETHDTGRARLRKHVVTEHQNVTVPVSREEVTVEREPITDANRGAAHSGPAISEEEHEVTLRAERPVVEKEAVPVERVRLGTETRTQHETVGGEVRKEQIEVDADDRLQRDRDDSPRRDRDDRRS